MIKTIAIAPLLLAISGELPMDYPDTSAFNPKLLPSNPFVISAEKVEEITQSCALEELMQSLIPIAKSYSQSPISQYKVGVVVLGKSGALYLGTNLEFEGVPLSACVHAEQFAIAHARAHGETGLIAMALSSTPCGHCRQFMHEMGADEIHILMPRSPAAAFSSLLPGAFGPKNFGLSGNLLTQNTPSAPLQKTSLKTKALEAAQNSYSPYSHSPSGLALKIREGTIYTGSYLENAAFNPSLSPLQIALIALLADLHTYEEIREVILVEHLHAKISQETTTREILNRIAPKALFAVEKTLF